MWTLFYKLASPPHFYRIAKNMIPWFAVPGFLLIAYGAFTGLFVAPVDYQQGDAFRIIYVHVPAAYLSLMAYMVFAVAIYSTPSATAGAPHRAAFMATRETTRLWRPVCSTVTMPSSSPT